MGEDISSLSAAELAAACIFHTSVDVFGGSSRTFAVITLLFVSVNVIFQCQCDRTTNSV